MSDWASSGTRMVYRILVRRRLKCQRAGTHRGHWQARCKACGVIG